MKHLLSSITLLLLSSLAFGQVPNSFSSGETISSAMMNNNFQYLNSLIDNLTLKITNLENELASKESKINQLELNQNFSNGKIDNMYALESLDLGDPIYIFLADRTLVAKIHVGTHQWDEADGTAPYASLALDNQDMAQTATLAWYASTGYSWPNVFFPGSLTIADGEQFKNSIERASLGTLEFPSFLPTTGRWSYLENGGEVTWFIRTTPYKL